MVGLMLGLLLSYLDSTIVATSLPSIFASLGGTETLAWVITAYMLTQTIMMPIAGKLSDIYGRKGIFIIGMIIFIVGSILSGMSNSIYMLIVCRAVQGLGGGVLAPVVFATIADLYGPKDRGKIHGLTTAVFTIASCIGPLVGGLIVLVATWQWIFYINLPIGFIAIAFTMMKFPKIQKQGRYNIDYLGIASLSSLILLLLLIFTWGGTTYSWASIEIITMSVGCVALLSLFMWIETKVKEPVLPLKLFKENVITITCIAMFITGLCGYGITAFTPSFMQNFIGVSAISSGIILIPMVFGLMITSLVSGFLLKRTGYKPWLLVGPPIHTLGIFLLSTLNASYSFWMASIALFILGLGVGSFSPAFIVAVQNVTPRKDLGVATSSTYLFRNIGGTIGLAILGTFINSSMGIQLAQNLPASMYDIVPHTTGIIDSLKSGVPWLLPYHDAIITSYGNSVCFGFSVAAIISVFILFASIAIKNVPLKSVEEYRKMSEQDELKAE